MDKSYLEVDLPTYLQYDIDQYLTFLEEKSTLLDCAYCELQSSINCAEVDDEITEEQADYLRQKYLGY